MTGDLNSVKLGAKLLIEGAKMLNTPCPVCRNPIYELRDKRLYCSFCQKEVIREGSESKTTEEKNTIKNEQDPVALKIAKLSQQLDNETNPEMIVKLAETIKKLQKIQQNKE